MNNIPTRSQHAFAAVVIQDDENNNDVSALPLAHQVTNDERINEEVTDSTNRSLDDVIQEEEDEVEEHEDSSSRCSNEFFSFPCSSSHLVKQRERFLMFLKVLVKYLELKDQFAFETLKEALRQCAVLRRQNLNEGFVLLEMYRRCKASVREEHWKTAHTYLSMFLEQQERKRRNQLRHAAPAASALVSSDGS